MASFCALYIVLRLQQEWCLVIVIVIVIVFGCSQAFDLPETESHGGLLGYDHQDLYLSMGLQRAHGREQESTTRPQEGMDGTVTWGGEKISIKCSNADDTVTAEVWKPALCQRDAKSYQIVTSKWKIVCKLPSPCRSCYPSIQPGLALAFSSRLFSLFDRCGTRIPAATSSSARLP